MMKTFVINMEKDVEKREKISMQLSLQPYLDSEIIKACEGRTLSENELKKIANIEFFRQRYGIQATLPALGCSISHYNVYKKIVQSNIKYALILEDDAILSEDLASVLSQFQSIFYSQTPTVMLLTPDFIYHKDEVVENKNDFQVVKVRNGYMTSGYLINYAGANLLLRVQSPVKYIADDWGVFQLNGLELYGVTPHLVSYADGLGEIGRSQMSQVEKSFYRKVRALAGRTKARLLWLRMYRKGLRKSKKGW